MARADEDDSNSLLAHAQFVGGSANKRLAYEVHRPGYKPGTHTHRRGARYNEWVEQSHGTEQKKTTAKKSTNTMRYDKDSNQFKRVRSGTKVPTTKLSKAPKNG